ncbi:glycosyltransferase [Kordiimonas gwangyangensis]|uniref:glycosyltransferase n=1 Tax=Kordiimonas gwangyangensis TaxID=288022 RepID=UPI00036001D2|nr:glycosyltransferase [Kordiimonas gwangyangensis]
MSRFYIVEQNALDVGGHYYNYTKEIAEAATEAGHDVTILSNIRFKDGFDIPGVEVVPSFHFTWLQAQWQPPQFWRSGMFSFDLCNTLYETGAKAGDRVFIHTIGDEELKTFLKYVCELAPASEGIIFHVLLRYDPESLARDFSVFRPFFEHIRASHWLKKRVIFHSDTEELSARFHALTGLPFHTAPIPFNLSCLLEQLDKNEPTAGDTSRPLNVAYVGDARREKNYQFLPDAVGKCLSDPALDGRVRFTLQSNFNFGNGEEGIDAARQALKAMPSDKVSLLFEKLDSDAYYDHIARADVVLISYAQRNYVRRSSGILIEAMAAGKPVIVTAGTWMAGQVTPDHAIIVEDMDQLSEAIKKAVLDYPRLKAGAEAIKAAVQAKATASYFLQELLTREPAAPTSREHSANNHVLVIAEGGAAAFPNGARRIVNAQLSYLARQGYRISVLFLVPQLAGYKEKQATIHALNKSLAPYGVEKVMYAFQSSALSDTPDARLGEVWQGVKFSIKFDLRQSERFDYSSETLKYLRNHRPDKILLNYITRRPVIDALGLDGIPVICETHDIQSQQRAIYGNRQLGSRDWQMECEELARCDALISLSESEAKTLRDALPDIPVHKTGCFPSRVTRDYLDLVGVRNAAELIAAAEPANPALRWHNVLDNRCPSELLLETSKIDLLFVSSNHKPNADGLRRFLRESYIPFLMAKKVNLVVAGTIDFAALAQDLGDLPHVHYIGPVENLEPLYAAARIAILPIWDGAGAAVKAFEALAHGIPVVMTSTALRGIGTTDTSLRIAETGEALATHIKDLLASRDRREEAAETSAQNFDTLCNPAHYDAVMAKMLPPISASREGDTAPCVGPYVELDGTVFQMNRLLLAWIEGHQITPDDTLRDLMGRPGAPEMVQAYRDILAGKHTVFDVPAFRSHPKLAPLLVNCQGRKGFVERFDTFTESLRGK